MKLHPFYILLLIFILGALGLYVDSLRLNDIEKDQINNKFVGFSSDSLIHNGTKVPYYSVHMNLNTNKVQVNRYSSPLVPAKTIVADSILRTGTNDQILHAYHYGKIIASITSTSPYHARWWDVKLRKQLCRKTTK